MATYDNVKTPDQMLFEESQKQFVDESGKHYLKSDLPRRPRDMFDRGEDAYLSEMARQKELLDDLRMEQMEQM